MCKDKKVIRTTKGGTEILERQTRQGWGAKVIDRLSGDLRDAFPEMKGFSSSNLKYMRFFAQMCPDLTDQLPWFHLVTVLTKISDDAEREWYAAQTIQHGWSRPTLDVHIRNQLHHRADRAGTFDGDERDGKEEGLNMMMKLKPGYKQTEVGRPPGYGLSKSAAEGHDENRGFAYWDGS